MSKFGYFISFAVGAVAGAVAAWKLLKDKYDERTEEALQSIRAAYNDYNEDVEQRKEDVENYIHILADTGYVNKSKAEREDYSVAKNEQKGGGALVEDAGPYVISPDEFGDNGYDIAYLTYYNDGVLVSDMNDRLDDADELVGTEFKKHFGEFDNPIEVIVRNDKLHCDYDITYDPRDYSDTQGSPEDD